MFWPVIQRASSLATKRDDIGDLLDTTQPAEYRHTLKSGD